MASSRGYDVVVDVDTEGDLGNTDLQEDLEFHSSTFTTFPLNPSKLPPPTSSLLSPSLSPSNPSLTSKNHPLRSLPFYTQFFDVDTTTVLHRALPPLLPFPLPFPFLSTSHSQTPTSFLTLLSPNPDLYGPFWISTTVILILFLTGTISQSLAAHNIAHFAYDFTLLTAAAGLVYGYTFVLPAVLWAVLRWVGHTNNNNTDIGGGGLGLLECWALYGYANVVWVPVALISWSPVAVLNWVVVAVGGVVSGSFLGRNMWGVVGDSGSESGLGMGMGRRRGRELGVGRVVVLVVVLLHAGFALAIKFLFFAHGSPIAKTPSGDGGGKAVDGTVEAMVRMM